MSEEEAIHRARKELALLEAERLRLSVDVMEGKLDALEENERLRQRIVELGRRILEMETEAGGGQE